MTEQEMETRINEIMDEYALLPQLSEYNLTLEAAGEKGDVKATLQKGGTVFEKTFGITDDLRMISDTFGYGEYITPFSCDISLEGLKRAYFNESGEFITERKGTTERFKVKVNQREKITEILREKLGKLFTG
jgi:hypothetical protein